MRPEQEHELYISLNLTHAATEANPLLFLVNIWTSSKQKWTEETKKKIVYRCRRCRKPRKYHEQRASVCVSNDNDTVNNYSMNTFILEKYSEEVEEQTAT